MSFTLATVPQTQGKWGKIQNFVVGHADITRFSFKESLLSQGKIYLKEEKLIWGPNYLIQEAEGIFFSRSYTQISGQR